MNVHFFQEPELEFGVGRHIDIKFGLMNYGPLDFDAPLAPKKIKVGIVGTPETIEGVAKQKRLKVLKEPYETFPLSLNKPIS